MKSRDILFRSVRTLYGLSGINKILSEDLNIVCVGDQELTLKVLSALGPCLDQGSVSVFSGRVSIRRLAWSDFLSLEEPLSKCLVIFVLEKLPSPQEAESVSEVLTSDSRALWFCSPQSASQGLYDSQHGRYPDFFVLYKDVQPEQILAKLLLLEQNFGLKLAFHFQNMKRFFIRKATLQTAWRNTTTAFASSLPVGIVPVVGPLLRMLATTGETLAITLSQVRLSLLCAALHGRSVDVLERVNELFAIFGSAIVWRSFAKGLASFIPGVAWLGKGVLAFSGTCLVGEASYLYFFNGCPEDKEVQKAIMLESYKWSHDAFVSEEEKHQLDSGFLHYVDSILE